MDRVKALILTGDTARRHPQRGGAGPEALRRSGLVIRAGPEDLAAAVGAARRRPPGTGGCGGAVPRLRRL
ncbi:MAG: hypothetical protein ACLUJG_15510 [Lawsonibacter sp.]